MKSFGFIVLGMFLFAMGRDLWEGLMDAHHGERHRVTDPEMKDVIDRAFKAGQQDAYVDAYEEGFDAGHAEGMKTARLGGGS
jgi:hypothetical protein